MRFRSICRATARPLMFACALSALLVTQPSTAAEQNPSNAKDVGSVPDDGATGSTSASLGTDIQKLKVRGEEYAKFVQQTPHESRWIYLNETARLDELLRSVLLSAVQEIGSFEDVRGRFPDVIQWQELPSAQAAGSLLSVSAPMVIGMERDVLAGLPELPLPIVLYRHVETKPGTDVALLMNAFVTKEQGQLFRIRTSPYAIVSWNGEAHLSILTQQFSYPGSEPWAGGHNMAVVDTFSSGERLPYVCLVEGPSGNAGGLTASIVRYDEAKNRWDAYWGTERSEVSGWRYEPETKTLHVKWHIGEETDIEELDMHALLNEGRAYRESIKVK